MTVANQNSTVTEILRITSPQARVILATFVAANLTLALTTLGKVYSPVPSLVGVVLISLASILVVMPAKEPFPLRRSAVLLLLVAVSNIIVDANLNPNATHGYAAWHLGAGTLVLLFLGLRGRTGLAWAGFAATVLIAFEWTLVVGENTFGLLALMPNQLGTLLVGTLFAIGLRRTSATIAALHAEQAAFASAQSATRAASAERARQSENLNRVARPALERIAAGAPFTEDERDAWMRLEASVRDSLRAPALNSEALTTATNDARERGVEVTLFDDSAGALDSASNREAVSSAIINELSGLTKGRLIGRVLPGGRGKLATILVDDGESTKRTDVR